MIEDELCVNCGEDFTPSKYDKRIKYCCNQCRIEARKNSKYTTKWSQENKEKVKCYIDTRKTVKNNSSKVKYATDLEQQNNSCAICKIDIKNYSHSFHVDHDHVTGGIRGLLCSECNLALGKFEDSIEILSNAINYLKGDVVG